MVPFTPIWSCWVAKHTKIASRYFGTQVPIDLFLSAKVAPSNGYAGT